MAETYNGAIAFVNSFKRIIGKQIIHNEGVGYLDIGEILEDGRLILSKFGPSNPIDKAGYMVCESLLGQEVEGADESLDKRIKSGTGYLVCFVDNLPIVIDRIKKASEVF